MKLLGAFMVPHPPLVVDEIGKDDIKQITKTHDSYLKIAKQKAEILDNEKISLKRFQVTRYK